MGPFGQGVDPVNITITGASGLIGRRLLKNLGGAGHALTVVSRHAGTNVPPGVGVVAWDPMRGPAPEDAVRNANVVIHLAGEPVAQRWNEGTKRRIRDSRVVEVLRNQRPADLAAQD